MAYIESIILCNAAGGSSFLSPVVTGKRHSGFHGSIPIKRMRTSAVASRQRAAGAAGPLVSGSAAHLGRSDISSGDTNSQQDEFATMIEGSSVLGRFTDAESSGAFMRSNMTADGVDSPVKNKKKKKIRPSNGGHSVSASYDVCLSFFLLGAPILLSTISLRRSCTHLKGKLFVHEVRTNAQIAN
jgi:hypothetical protein